MTPTKSNKIVGVTFIDEGSISVGKNVAFGYNCVVDGDPGNISLEDNVNIGHNCIVQSKKGKILIRENTTIGNNSLIKANDGNITLLNNSIIGDSCIINAAGGEITIGQRTKIDDHSKLYSENGKIVIGDDARIDPDNEIHGKGAVSFGDRCHLWSGSYINAFQNPFDFDYRVSIGQKCVIAGRGNLSVGKLTMIGGQTYVVTETHGHENPFISFRDQDFETKGISIGEDVWIAAACRIIDGVNIGKRALIGIGTIITKDVPEYMLALGTNQHYIKFIKDRRDDFIYSLEKQMVDEKPNTAPNSNSVMGFDNTDEALKEMESYLIDTKNYSIDQIEALKRYFRKASK